MLAWVCTSIATSDSTSMFDWYFVTAPLPIAAPCQRTGIMKETVPSGPARGPRIMADGHWKP
jgi:hypothetical protein